MGAFPNPFAGNISRKMSYAELTNGYPEQKDFNHFSRIAETIALRIKNPKAIVLFEAEK